jgi:hypothetical protein
MVLSPGHLHAATQAESVVACRPDATAVELGDTITLRAFSSVTTASADAQKFRWTASGGTIQGQGVTVAWQLPSAQPGPYTATVHVEGAGAAPTCTLKVFALLAEQIERGPETRRRALTPKTEPSGFHRYSYFLLGSKPTDEITRQRYLSALQAWVAILPVPEDLIPSSALNVTFLPLTSPPANKADTSAEWLLEHYDWERARFLLQRLAGDHLRGPYIVSSRQPLGALDVLDKDYLFQDLSTVPPQLVNAWVREFSLQSAQEQFWNERSWSVFALKLRTVIGTLASALPDMRSSIASLIVLR